MIYAWYINKYFNIIDDISVAYTGLLYFTLRFTRSICYLKLNNTDMLN